MKMPAKKKTSMKKKKNVQRQQPNQNQQPKQRKKRVKKSTPSVNLSSAVAHYACAIGSPFSPEALSACVPTIPARPSQKVASRQIGTYTIGSAGTGFVAIAPTVVNYAVSIFSTTAGYSSVSISCTPGTVTKSNITNNPYPIASFIAGGSSIDASIMGRIVSVGLRVRYIGTELNRGGMLMALVEPNHGSIDSYSQTDLTAYRECIRRPVTRNWTTIVAAAIDFKEQIYPDTNEWLSITPNGPNVAQLESTYPFSNGSNLSGSPTTGAPIMVILTTGTPGNTFEFEVIHHLELIGKPVQSLATPSHSDQEGLSRMIEVKGIADLEAASNSKNTSYEQAFSSSMKSSLSSMATKYMSSTSVANMVARGHT